MFLIAGLKYAWNGTVKWKLNGTLSVCSYVVWGYSYSCNWHCLSYLLYRSIYLTVELGCICKFSVASILPCHRDVTVRKLGFRKSGSVLGSIFCY